MSEPMFPSSAGDAAPAVSDPQPQGTNRKALLTIGGVVGALVIGGGAFFLLNGSGGGGDQSLATPQPGAAASVPAPAPSASSVTVTTIKTVTVAARDPFAPLFPAPAAPAAPAAAPVSTTPLQGPTLAPVAKVTLAVSAIDATKQTATVSVDGVKYPVAIGKVFAKTFVLYSVFNAQCVGVLFGDQSVPVCTTAPATVSP